MPQTYPTDERGILTDRGIEQVVRDWVARNPDNNALLNRAQWPYVSRVVAGAQHQADVEKVEAVFALLLSENLSDGIQASSVATHYALECCRLVVLAALEVKP